MLFLFAEEGEGQEGGAFVDGDEVKIVRSNAAGIDSSISRRYEMEQ